ncbi:MAG: MMPL family transporter, partial [Verrucomicrobiota bacterium]
MFFSPENPQLRAFEKLRTIYTKDDNIMFVLHKPDGDVFTPEYLAAISWLTDEAWRMGQVEDREEGSVPDYYVQRVDSLTNFQHSVAFGEDDLLVEDLVERPERLSADELAEIARVARTEPLLYNRVVGERDDYAAVNLTLTFPENHAMEMVVAATDARLLRDRFLERYPGFTVYLTGAVMLNHAFSESAMRDMSTLIPLMYLGIIITMVLLLRSWAGTLATLLVIICSTMVAMGLMGFLGIAMSAPVSTAPIMIMTLAVADSIHVLISLLHEMRQGKTKREALIESLRINFQPVLLTSVTTIIGFLSMNFSDAPPFRDLGNVVAMGVAAAWFFSIFFLPAVIAVLPLKVKARPAGKRLWADRLAEIVVARRRLLLWGSIGGITVLALVIPRLELNDQFVDYFGESIEFRTDTDITMDNLTGIYNMEYSLESAGSGGINEPEYLAQVESFTQWWREQPGVLQAFGIADFMKRINKNMHGDDMAYYRVPEDRELAAQYLLLFEMSLPYGMDLNNTVNVDKSASRLTVVLENLTTREVRDLIERAEVWKAENLPPDMHALPASTMVMFSYISERNITSMLTGTGLALLLISVLLAIALRSGRYGLISLIPNFAPAVVGFGIWTLLVGEMGMSLAPVTGMTLGIVVDDTVHFLSKYLRGRREKGLEAADAVRHAFHQVGTALLVTTVILVAGFTILSFSSFRLNSWMGELTAIVIFLALVIDLLFLPSLLITLDGKKRTEKTLNQETPHNDTEPVTA